MGSTGNSTRDGLIRLLMAVAWWLIAACSLVLLLNAFVLVNTAEDSCGAGVDSYGHYGTAGWSWLPPGETCAYEVAVPSALETTTLVTGGTWYLVSTVLLMGVCAALLVSMGRLRGSVAPPGWYADPDDTTRLRFWDGRAWTQNRR